VLVAPLAHALRSHPTLSLALTVLSFSFLGPLAAVVVVATLLAHEIAHWMFMYGLGYKPGPVRVLPFLGAFVRAGTPMLRSADIALIYLAGPVAGVGCAAGVTLLANVTLGAELAHQVTVGATVAIALNVINLIPIEPLDGGLIARALPYPALLFFPGALALWLWYNDVARTEIDVLLVVGAVWIAVRKVRKWRHYLAHLRTRARRGDVQAAREWRESVEVPLPERVLVVAIYLLLLPLTLHLLQVLGQQHAWLL
jgi:membrane-associated protease RseP (regulator of RpoE activity)